MTKKRIRKTTLETKITVRLDPQQLTRLEGYADEEGTTVSFMVRHLVRRFLEEKQRLAPFKHSASPTRFMDNEDW